MHEVPEAKPAILLAWADSSDDLAAIKAAGQVLDLDLELVWFRFPFTASKDCYGT